MINREASSTPAIRNRSLIASATLDRLDPFDPPLSREVEVEPLAAGHHGAVDDDRATTGGPGLRFDERLQRRARVDRNRLPVDPDGARPRHAGAPTGRAGANGATMSG